MSRRTLIVGDVHGCAQELDDLLERAGFSEKDRLVFVGDLVAKGPDSMGVIQRARALNARAVRGNHDQHCLRWWDAKQQGAALPELRSYHRQVADTIEESDWQWLAALPLFLRLEEHNTIVVHAGLVPGVALEAQEPFDLMNMRTVGADGTASKHYDGGTPWPTLWEGPELVVFGHDAIRGLQRHPYAVGLDTGCVYGGSLTGLLLPEQTVVSVPAREMWSAPE